MRAPAPILSALALVAVIALGLSLSSQIRDLQDQIRDMNRPSSILVTSPELDGINRIQTTLSDIGSQLDSIGTTVSGLESAVGGADNSGVLDELGSVHAAISDLQFEVQNVCAAVGC